jgi:hypothetical protein
VCRSLFSGFSTRELIQTAVGRALAWHRCQWLGCPGKIHSDIDSPSIGATRRVQQVPDQGSSTMKKPCPFCTLAPIRVIAVNQLAFVVRNAFPVSPGHTLIIPRRHIGSFFKLAGDERTGMLTLLDAAKEKLETEFHPDGYRPRDRMSYPMALPFARCTTRYLTSERSPSCRTPARSFLASTSTAATRRRGCSATRAPA